MRQQIALPRPTTDHTTGAYATLPAPAVARPWARGDGHAVALNLSDAPVVVDAVSGRIAIATDRARDGEVVDGIPLGPSEAAVVAR